MNEAMRRREIFISLLIFTTMFVQKAEAQTSDDWNGKQCAVVLTYDDALNVHLDNAIPCLDSFNIKGTFYLTGSSPLLASRIVDWRKAAQEGHELGNHTLFHPCDGQLEGREWVSPESDLSTYSVQRAVNEIRVTNTLLHAIDGKAERTFAYPCGDMKIDTVNYYQYVKNEFIGARGVQSEMQSIREVDLDNIRCYGINEQSGDYMINLVQQAMETNTLLVFLFHGVGGEHSINVSLEAHRQLVNFLYENESLIWVAPMVDVSNYIRKCCVQ